MEPLRISLLEHVVHPFSLGDLKQDLSLNSKIQAFVIALFATISAALFLNKFVALFVGMTVFYGITAYEKIKMLAIFNQAQPQEHPIDGEKKSHESTDSLEPAVIEHAEEKTKKPQAKIEPVIKPHEMSEVKQENKTAEKVRLPAYDTKMHQFSNIDLQDATNMKHWRNILQPEDKKNIQAVARFGDWKGMGYNADSERVKSGKPFRLLEKMAVEMPELSNFAFFDKRGNGECGYRTLVDGIIYEDCILVDRVDVLKHSFQNAFDSLIDHWNSLPFAPEEKNRFQICMDQALHELERMKKLSIDERIALLQNEAFLDPFLKLVRCLIVSQTKAIEEEKPGDKVRDNDNEAVKIRELIKDHCKFSEKEAELFAYALVHYPLNGILNDEELPDLHGNDDKNQIKESIRELVKRAHQTDPHLVTQLYELYLVRNEFQNKEDILATPLPEYLDLGISLEEFLTRKALGNADSPTALWALASDFTALGYALNKNICCIFGDAFKDNVFDVVKTYRDRPASFYGLNLTTQAHYNALIPLIA